MDMSLKEARELAELTDRIVANVKIIEEKDATLGYEWLEETTSAILANLKMINEDQNDLEELERSSSTIVANLITIKDDNTDLDDLEQTASVSDIEALKADVRWLKQSVELLSGQTPVEDDEVEPTSKPVEDNAA